MSTYPLQIVTPTGLFFDGEVQRTVLRTTQGDVAILKNHIDYMAPLGVGEMRLLMPDGTKRSVACAGGFVRVTKELTRVLAVTCEWSDEIDLERAERSAEEAQRRLRNKTNDYELKMADFKLKRDLNRIRIAQQ